MRLKSILVTLFKITLAIALLSWLIRSGQLDLSQLNRFLENYQLTGMTVGYFLLGPLLIGTLRWKTLLEAAGFRILWKRALQLQSTGFFFNTVMPGAVGGDLVKIAYVIRDNPQKSRALSMVTVVLDRIVGLCGLFLVGWVCMMLNFSDIAAQPKLWPLIVMMSGISIGFVLFFTAALYHYRGQDPFQKLLQKPIPGFKFVAKLYEALRIYRNARSAIWLCILYSFTLQVASLFVFYFITKLILDLPTPPAFGPIATIYPIGVLTTAVPITPGGLGVGHVAFDRLFQMIGLQHGANVFNLFLLSQLFLNLTGIIPYLALKKDSKGIALEDSDLPSLAVNPK